MTGSGQNRRNCLLIISGGQTGVDQGALELAEELGLQTGGWMPKGWLTEDGPRPEFKDRFRMFESTSAKYPPRTRLNVEESDATLLYGWLDSPGCRLTRRYCQDYARIRYDYDRGLYDTSVFSIHQRELVGVILEMGVSVLNVAGNRESKRPGINREVKEFLRPVLEQVILYRTS